MLIVGDKEYRNIQQQVDKNTSDIAELKENPVVDAYTKAESDAKFQTKSSMSTYVTNHDFELTIDALATGVEQELSNKVDKYKHFDDDDNPEDYNIKQPQTYGSGIQLTAARDDNHHPDYSDLIVKPTQINIATSSANHGDDDVDYTGSIELTDDYVDIKATDGEDTTTLRVTPTGVTVNGDPIGGGTEVSGTNDGTNWTTLTIGNTTKNIPQGGSSSMSPYINRVVSYTVRPKHEGETGNLEWFMNVPLLLTNTCTDSETFGHPIIDLDTTAANNRIGIEGYFCMRDTANDVTTIFWTGTSNDPFNTVKPFRTFILNRKENSTVNVEKCRIRATASIPVSDVLQTPTTKYYTAYRLDMTANPDLKLTTNGGSQLISLSVGNFDKNSNVTYIETLPTTPGTYVLKATVNSSGICTGIK